MDTTDNRTQMKRKKKKKKVKIKFKRLTKKEVEAGRSKAYQYVM